MIVLGRCDAWRTLDHAFQKPKLRLMVERLKLAALKVGRFGVLQRI